MILRLAFGLSLALVGVAHYMNIGGFVEMTSGGLGALAPLGMIWAYILPALQIVGGLLIAFNVRGMACIGKVAAGLALGSIAVGMTLKGVMTGDLGGVMPMVQNAFIWLIVYALACKSLNCGDGACDMKK